jgi:hypothetical protein
MSITNDEGQSVGATSNIQKIKKINDGFANASSPLKLLHFPAEFQVNSLNFCYYPCMGHKTPIA